MAHKDEISKAVGAHGMWKQRLAAAISSGTSDFTIDKVRPDNNCAFGKWLHGLPASEKTSEHWTSVQALHAQFHQEASEVLKLALVGMQEDATKAMSIGSSFALTSARLTGAMMAWAAVSA